MTQQPKLADHARMMQLVEQISPETRRRIAQGLDDRFHEATGAPRAPECCGTDANRPVPCGSTPDNPRCTVSKHAICEKHH